MAAADISKVLNSFEGRPARVEVRGHVFDFASKVYLMGILNHTPDSFYPQGRFPDFDEALARGLQIMREGADIVEVGGQTAQPSQPTISVAEEIERVAPLIERLVKETGLPLAVDTYRSEVAEAALQAGASIINDISGLAEPRMADLATRYGAMLVVMHIRNRPKVDFHQPEHRWSLEYGDVVREVYRFLRERAALAAAAGVPPQRIIIDPGLGFDKLYLHDVALMRRLAELRGLGHPILLATSRKNYIGELLDLPVEELLEGTAAAVAWGVMQGANILRVHDVQPIARLTRLLEYLMNLRPLPSPDQVKLWK